MRLVQLDAGGAEEADVWTARQGSAQGERCDDQYCSGVYQRRPGTQFERAEAGFGGVLLRCAGCGWDSAEFWPINPR